MFTVNIFDIITASSANLSYVNVNFSRKYTTYLTDVS